MGCFGLDLVEYDFLNDVFDWIFFKDYLERNELMMFCYWVVVGWLVMDCLLVMIVGIFGEVLGGYYGMLNLLLVKKKYFLFVVYMIGGGGVVD